MPTEPFETPSTVPALDHQPAGVLDYLIGGSPTVARASVNDPHVIYSVRSNAGRSLVSRRPSSASATLSFDGYLPDRCLRPATLGCRLQDRRAPAGEAIGANIKRSSITVPLEYVESSQWKSGRHSQWRELPDARGSRSADIGGSVCWRSRGHCGGCYRTS